ncbi:MAG: hypothetical protein JO079_07100 [Frankiaceae bacterium]|nr:hypothetical protein [Frankiaceae bacterium]MBV9369332.1 hypothetical protein [Frankiales bacterium]
MTTGHGVLVVVTTNASDTADVVALLQAKVFPGDITVATGFYAAVAALGGDSRAIVADIGAPDGRDGWRLAELRNRGADATFAVVADATHLPQLAGALQTDLAVTSARQLPPLRELIVTDEALVDDQTIWRRTMR